MAMRRRRYGLQSVVVWTLGAQSLSISPRVVTEGGLRGGETQQSRDPQELARILVQECGVWISDGVAAREDGLGGLGIFASRGIARGEIVARIPWESCVTPRRAAEYVGLESRDDRASQCVALAAALVKAAQSAHGPWAWYARTLPWHDLRHPLLTAETVDDAYVDYASQARRAAVAVAEITGTSLEMSFRAVLFVLSRSFNLSHLIDDGFHAVCLVPFYDLVNHPSVSLVKTLHRFGDLPVSGAVSGSTTDGAGHLCVRAPSLLELAPGDQLLGWYGNAGWGTQDPVQSAQETRKFELQYGFNPWRD